LIIKPLEVLKPPKVFVKRLPKMPKNIFYKTLSLTKVAGTANIKFPTPNPIEKNHIIGFWMRRRGKVLETGSEITTDVVKDACLVLKRAGVTHFDPLPIEIIMTTNELTGTFYPIDMDGIDWLGSEIQTGNLLPAQIEIVVKYII
jgi:hypothetical protein